MIWSRMAVIWASVSAVFVSIDVWSRDLRVLREAAVVGAAEVVEPAGERCCGCLRETGVTALTVSRVPVSDLRRSPE
jgi:hypothetical protein